jgi:hypothetical protein
MAQDILPVLRDEEKRLEAELSQTAPFQKLEAVRRLISVYTGQLATGTVASAPTSISATMPRHRAGKGKGAAILDAAEDFLESLGRRAMTGEIAAELAKRGLPPGNKNLNGAMSAYLSSAKDRFDNKVGEGYGLVKWSRPKSDENSPQREAEGLAPSVPSLTHQ